MTDKIFLGPNTGLSPETVKESLDEVYYTEFDFPNAAGQIGAEDTVFFKQQKTEKGAVQTEEFEPATMWDEHAEEEEVRVDTIRTGNKKTHTVLNYKKALKIPVEYYEDEMHGVVDKAVESMGRKAKLTKNQTAINKWVLGFSSETTSDGTAVFSNTHTVLDGSTVDNLETGTLTPANLEALIRSLRKQKDNKGDLGGHDAYGLLVALNLHEDALEITESELKPGGAQNDVNIHNRIYSKVYPSLQTVATSAYIHSDFSGASNVNTMYFVASRNHSLRRWVRVAMDTWIRNYTEDDKLRYTYGGRYREVTSWIDPFGVVASNGTV